MLTAQEQLDHLPCRDPESLKSGELNERLQDQFPNSSEATHNETWLSRNVTAHVRPGLRGSQLSWCGSTRAPSTSKGTRCRKGESEIRETRMAQGYNSPRPQTGQGRSDPFSKENLCCASPSVWGCKNTMMHLAGLGTLLRGDSEHACAPTGNTARADAGYDDAPTRNTPVRRRWAHLCARKKYSCAPTVDTLARQQGALACADN